MLSHLTNSKHMQSLSKTITEQVEFDWICGFYATFYKVFYLYIYLHILDFIVV